MAFLAASFQWRVHFADSLSGANFDQDAFWAADTSQPKLFKVRVALPAGSWTWSIAGCSGTTGGKSCASGVTWTPASGPITVTASTSGPQIYARGFPTQFPFISTDGTFGFTQLVYADLYPFFWSADTAWASSASSGRSCGRS